MMVFAIGIEDALNVTVQGLHHADSRKHRRAAVAFGDKDQRLYCGFPSWLTNKARIIDGGRTGRTLVRFFRVRAAC
jgi:hypothetical protein